MNCERCFMEDRRLVPALGEIDAQPLCKVHGIEVAVEAGDSVLELAWRAKGNGAGLAATAKSARAEFHGKDATMPEPNDQPAPALDRRDRPRAGAIEQIADVTHRVLREHGAISVQAPVVERREEKQMPKPKASCVGCNKGLRKDSPGFDVNLCAKCYRVGQELPVPARKKPGRKPKFHPETSHQVPIAAEIPSKTLEMKLTVTPEWLVKAFSRFSPEQKLAAVSFVLEQ